MAKKFTLGKALVRSDLINLDLGINKYKNYRYKYRREGMMDKLILEIPPDLAEPIRLPL